MLVALLSYLLLKLVSLIPFVGWLVVMIIIVTAFGSLFLTHAKWRKQAVDTV